MYSVFFNLSIVFYKIIPKKQKRADLYSRLFVKSYSLHHHRLLAAIAEGKHKPSVVVDGDALDDSVETAIAPFGVEKFKLSEFKEESAEDIRFIFLVRSLLCKSRITLL